MAVLKCKMCGGDLNIQDDATVVECEYCGTKQTVPTANDEKKITLFGRANRLRFACEFDKAAGVYESIVADFSEEAEAYWGLLLCKYGIEYVDDPATGKKVPTCHRSSFDSVMDDENFEQALENADPIARSVYRDEAKQIEELRKGIIEVSGKEEPYDIFICYKETAENGERTIDSVIAQDVYDELTAKGYRVFFSRITLEDKLGQEYEPYIFAALNSAKIMLAFGTDYEYYNAVWVKNEWSRFLQLIAKGEKKTLIPCYKNIDAYDMPKEFAKLQAQDMGKVGAVQDLLRGIEKIISKKETEKEHSVVQQPAQSATVDSLLKRAFMYLEDKEWKNATDYCNRVLDIDPECSEAYVGLLMAELHVIKRQYLNGLSQPFDSATNYKKILRYADDTLKAEIEGYNNAIIKRNKYNADKAVYNEASEKIRHATKSSDFNSAAKMFEKISGFEDAAELAEKYRIKGELEAKRELYDIAYENFKSPDPHKIIRAKTLFERIPDYKDASELAAQCDEAAENARKEIAERRRIAEEEKRIAEEEKRIAEEKAEEKRRVAEKKQRKQDNFDAAVGLVIILIIIAAVVGAGYTVYHFAWKAPKAKYDTAAAHLEAGEYEAAITLYTELKNFKDSKDKLSETKYIFAEEKLENGDVDGAYLLFSELARYDTEKKRWSSSDGGYNDSKERRAEIVSQNARLAEVSDIVIFGSYEQDNVPENGKEAIEWFVLDKKEGNLVLISKKALDAGTWGPGGYVHRDWENSELRIWLNGEFYNTAFTEDEKSRISVATLKTPGEKDENITQDAVFLLSTDEYSDEDDYHFIFEGYEVTAYADSKLLKKKDYFFENSNYFWLREPLGGTSARIRYDALDNKSDSGISQRGNYFEAYIRPCIYLNIGS